MTTIYFHFLDWGETHETLSRRIILFQLLVFLPMPRKPYTPATSGKVSAANAVASTVVVRDGWAFWRPWKQGRTLM